MERRNRETYNPYGRLNPPLSVTGRAEKKISNAKSELDDEHA